MADLVNGLTIAALCRQVAGRYPRRTVLVHGSDRISFAELDICTTALAVALQRRGIGRGDRVAALVLNGLPFMQLAFAAAKLGAIFLPLNWRLAPPELAYILGDASPALWFVSEELRPLAAEAGGGLPAIEIAATGTWATDEYQTLLATPAAASDLVDPEPSDPWLMLYTSGTTGRPKGCLLSHAGQYATTFASMAYWRIGCEDSLYTSLPLFHVGGLGVLMSHLAAGAATVIAPYRADPDSMLRGVSEAGCTSLSVAPSQLLEMMERQRVLGLELRPRRTTMGGGMHAPALIREVQAVFNTAVLAGYGQTEAGNFVAYLSDAEQLARPTACGTALAHLETRIVDESDREVAPGEIGELCLRGASVMLGYWKNADATAAALRGGWLHTGDNARIDEDGYIHLVGRTKQLIKSGGENVYPREVELVLLAHELIVDCAVFGVPDPRWGEAVKAAVVLAPGAMLGLDEIVAWCRQHIAGYKRPRYIELVDAIPRSELGKVQVAELQARPLAADQRTG